MTETHVEKNFKCKKCNFSCESEQNMKEHETTEHPREQLFECDECQYDSIIKSKFDAHIKTQHTEKSKLCIFWNKGFCHYGMDCHYIHEEIPECKYQDRCENTRCSYFHHNKSWNIFLGRSLRRQSQKV